MNLTAAVVLCGLGAVGFYAIGTAAVEHKRAVAGGELPTHIPADYESTVADDLLAFTAAMAAIGIAFNETPDLINEARTLLP